MIVSSLFGLACNIYPASISSQEIKLTTIPFSFAEEVNLDHYQFKLDQDSIVFASEDYANFVGNFAGLEDSQNLCISSNNTQTESPTTKQDSHEFMILPLGVNIGTKNAIESTLVRGYEDGAQAINFDDWLIAFNDIVSAFNLKVERLEDGQLELRSPYLAKVINPDDLIIDDEIGLSISIAQIGDIFDTTTTFSLEEYALIFNPPWLGKKAPKDRRLQFSRRPVSLDGLPEINAPAFSFTTIGQQTNFNSSGSNEDSSGELVGVGSTMGGSWLFRIDQDELGAIDSWELEDAQFLRQTPQLDYVLGIQPTFWNRSNSSGKLSGFTTIKRWGFSSPHQRGSREFNFNQRLSSSENFRTIVGEAEPGSLVKLATTVGNIVIDEVFVDSSGVYRFEDVATSLIGFRGVTGIGNNYRVLIYEDGDLGRDPIIRAVTFTNLPGQLSKGTSALVVSAGAARERGQDNFFGEFGGINAGFSYRWGTTEDLTLGFGAIYDESALALTEVFFQPDSSLTAKASILIGGDDGIDLNANVRYRPFSRVTLELNSDEFSSQLRADWDVNSELSLSLTGDTEDAALGAGVRWGRKVEDLNIRTALTLDTNSNLRWDLFSRLNQWELRHRGSEVSTSTELTYELNRSNFDSTSNDLIFGFDTDDESNNLVTFGWDYQSGKRTRDNRKLWGLRLEYGMGTQGQGIIATMSTSIIPGVELRARYDNISLSSNESRFRLDIAPSLFLQPKLRPGSSNFESLRTQGGLFIQPFLDNNGNGKKDKGEKFYNEDLEFLLLLNNRPLKDFTINKPEIRDDGLLANLFPGKYRLDLDSAGYPIGWKATETAYAINIRAGGYTTVTVPLVPSYVLAGAATDRSGEAIGGAKIEALSMETGLKYLSVTNGVGIFYLESLPQGTYEILINGNPAEPGKITLDENSETFQEINLKGSS